MFLAMALHPAEHRCYRELYLSAKEAETRTEHLAETLGEEQAEVLTKAAASLATLLEELAPETARYDVHGELAAKGGGGRIGMVRAEILDRFLERNQALRLAVDDLEHVATLLAYAAALSSARRRKRLPELCVTWERKIRRHVSAVRKAAIELGSDPDAAIEPLDSSRIGKAAHGAAVAVGTVGEWVDRKAAEHT